MEESLTLEKFEEASEDGKEGDPGDQSWFTVSIFLLQTGNKVYFKPENMQYTGAYKVRGAYYKISTLTEEEKQRGLITASAGNHAQGVAYAAKLAGCQGNCRYADHNSAHEGEPHQEAMAQRLFCTEMYSMRPATTHMSWQRSTDIPLCIRSMTWMWQPVREPLPWRSSRSCRPVDYILVPIGGGGLCTGVSTLAKLLNPKIKVIGVEPAGANCMQESLKDRTGADASERKHHCRRYCGQTSGRKAVPVHPEKCG